MRTLLPRSLVIALALAGVAVGSAVALGQPGIGGFAQTNYAARVSGESSSSGMACDFPLGDERLQLKLEAFSEDGTAAFASKVDFFRDAVLDEANLEVRETYLDLSSKHVAIRAGRQIITWGVGDLLFVNDVFPKDWVAFFTGRPLQYLKVASDAIKLSVYTGFVDTELVLSPFFQADHYPTGARLVLPDPLPAGAVEDPERTFENMEIAGKLSKYGADWQVAAYASMGRFGTPAMALGGLAAPNEAHFFFPRLNTFGTSATGGLLGGVLSVEGAYYDSEDDRGGNKPGVENSHARGLLGYSLSPGEDATLGVQAYAEWMLDYGSYLDGLGPNRAAAEELRWVATMRFTRLLLHQTLTLNVFAFWGVSDDDAYLIPSIRYAFTDALWGEIGANFFAGSGDDTMFGALDKNDNIYVTARFGF